MKRTLGQEAHKVLCFSHGTTSMKAIITQGLKFSGHAIKRVLWVGRWTVSLPKQRNGPLQGGGNSTAFPESFFPFQHQSCMNSPNLLDPHFNRGPQSPSLLSAGPPSASCQGQDSWKHGKHKSQPLPDPHTIKSFSAFKASYSLPQNICNSINIILL